MELYGKSRQEIAQLTKKKSRSELLDLLFRHVSLEPMFSPEMIGSARQLSPKTIKKLMKDGTIPSHQPAGQRLRATLSAVALWDEKTALTLGKTDATDDAS